ncbi:HigA family addiction module antitoxin [Mammaliicoccus sp. M-M45]|uniref:HigA family addiction module antitoxin n=1 Tax=Mammaliicoccus sp. M-M45 TaxID=2898704 RepID=UPI001EFBA066|nr:HigA family addiction module antitoxin [Mammaliicoccus sp. M-M45]
MVKNLILEHNNQMAFHPGVYIQDSLEDLDMTQRELATRVDTSPKTISEIVRGEQSLTPKMAINISKVFNVDSQTWLNIQTKYDTLKLEIEQDKYINDQKSLLKSIDYPKLVKLGVVSQQRKSEDKIKELCRVFKIANLEILKSRELAINFRASAIEKDSDVINTNLWIEMVSHKLSSKSTLKFDKEKLEGSMSTLKNLTVEEPSVFMPRIDEVLKECGVHFIIMPSLKNAKPKGMVMWRDDKITLAMSNKGKYADIFWFTFFHEIGHIILHPHKNFIELDGKNQREQEADDFARKTLIKDEIYNDFIATSDFSMSSIQHFANSEKINQSIIIGRLQNDGIIPYSRFANQKTRYIWAFESEN